MTESMVEIDPRKLFDAIEDAWVEGDDALMLCKGRIWIGENCFDARKVLAALSPGEQDG